MAEIPLDQLTLRDGALARQPHPQHPAVPFMHTPAVHIVSKNNLAELDGGIVSFMFALNAAPDDAWIALFDTERSSLAVEIQGAQADVHCKPGELDSALAKLKDAIAASNRRYVEARAQLIERLVDQDHARQKADLPARERTRALHEQFDRLKL